jgi:hypothetical protein
MQSAQCPQEDAAHGSEGTHGLVLGLLIAIPLWVLAGLAVILLLQNAPVTAAENAMLMIAAACEFILLRYSLRTFDAKARYRELLARSGLTARHTGPRPSIAKQALALSALVAAYLHYYFWDVHLQIASLNSVTVFVPASVAG